MAKDKEYIVRRKALIRKFHQAGGRNLSKEAQNLLLEHFENYSKQLFNKLLTATAFRNAVRTSDKDIILVLGK